MKPLESLRALGTGEEAPIGARDRVRAAMFSAIAGAGALEHVTQAPPAAPVPLVAGIAGSKVTAIAAAVLLLGGGTGAALYGIFRPQDVRVVYVERPVAVPSAPLLLEEPEPVMSASPPVSVPSAVVSRHAAAPSAASANSQASELSRERALLDLARSHAARGEPDLALLRAEQHRAQFPLGRLAEEREALAIRALQSLGRIDEARERAAAFRAAYPRSFLLPLLDSALSAP